MCLLKKFLYKKPKSNIFGCNVALMDTPKDLKYTSDHEWVRIEEGNRVKIGITDFAQDALGDIVYVELPDVNRVVAANESFSEVESTKSVSDIYAPLAGKVVEVNDVLSQSPEKVNSDPYGEGWICVIEISDKESMESMLNVQDYLALTVA